MPWRGCGDPYGIWLSEIMLQQTQIVTVIPYWHKFMEHYPAIRQLAAATEEAVLEDWAGLGYYSRGRNLHRAAKEIVDQHDAEFPRDPEAVRALPGIGEYTTAAICSIAFGTELAVVDGNVERVICRHRVLSGDPKKGETKKQIREVAQQWLSSDCPGDHNQAMMDLGRNICTPRNPHCGVCPIAEDCQAKKSGDPHRWPEPKKRRPTEKQQWVSALFVAGDRLLLLPGNQELLKAHAGPVLVKIEKEGETTEAILSRELENRNLGEPDIIGFGDRYRHSITHRQLDVQPVLCRWKGKIPEGVRTIDRSSSGKLPVLHRKTLESLLPLLETIREEESNADS
jgi:A/G-specific adenine glycosylase